MTLCCVANGEDVNASSQPGENSCALDLQFEGFNLQRKGLKMSYSATLTLLSGTA